MNFKEIKELISLVSESDLREFRMRDKEFEIRIRTDKDTLAPVFGQQSLSPLDVNLPIQKSSVVLENFGESGDSSPLQGDDDVTSNLVEIKSPMVGTFYRSASPEKPSFIQIGDSISTGAVVCIIEAMKLFNEIESEVSGRVVKVLVEDSTPVEYDQVLFLIDPGS